MNAALPALLRAARAGDAQAMERLPGSVHPVFASANTAQTAPI